jgi:hypothetical protein
MHRLIAAFPERGGERKMHVFAERLEVIPQPQKRFLRSTVVAS